MIKRILSSRLPAVAYNPPGIIAPGYFQALAEAGCLPVFDTEFISSEMIISTITRLAETGILFGVRVFTRNRDVLDFLSENRMPTLDLIILAYHDKDELEGVVFDPGESHLFLETVDINIAGHLAGIQPEALILKGSEAPGRISGYTSFVLMQWYLKNTDYPLFIHGGVGFHTAAGMFAAGVSGVVLDNQLYLTEEAPLSAPFKEALARLEEFDSSVVGRTLSCRYRFFSKLATRIVKKLQDTEISLAGSKEADSLLYDEISKHITHMDSDDASPVQSLFYLGMDGVFAKHFVKKTAKLHDVIQNFFKTVGETLSRVDTHNPLKKGSQLAVELGCDYPIIQGPMANISDNADFASIVYENGGFPFFAMGSLPADIAEDIIESGQKKVKRFGAGLIGIEALNTTVRDHIELVKKYNVPFALFAGGIPSQVQELEAAGTRTWLHTPAMGMLENAISAGCSGFIFEGTEAGGHVGRLTSLVLWELAIEKLLALDSDTLKRKTAIFAGGIGTESASHFISGMTSVLAAKGVSTGIQLGTPYLFTKEIVETGALKKKYQEVISDKNETMRMGTTVGLASRTVKTPFSIQIIENEHSRIRDGIALEERKKAFEHENIGSLLVSAKGYTPDFESLKNGGGLTYIHYDDNQCFEKGNYCTGDSLAFHSKATTVKEIHRQQTETGDALFRNLNALEIFSSATHEINDEIAVIGMGCVYPDAQNPQQFWENIITKKYSIGEIPADRFDHTLFYDEDRKARDKSYTKIAGVISGFTFEHEKFGLTAEEGENLSRSQQMILEAADQAVKSAGYPGGQGLPGKSTAVIIGSCLGNELSNRLNLKYFYPELKFHLDQIEEYGALPEEEKSILTGQLKEKLSGGRHDESPDCTTLNIEASRVAAWLGAEGANYVVDAACATSFAAIDCGIRELLSGSHDVVVTGGLNTNLAPESFVGFCKMGALSARGSFPFDERSDGFVLGEGAGVVVLKRMKDAVRDGDPVIGIIKSVGASSDGRGKAIAAPKAEGQAYALSRCFEKMDAVSVEDIDYIEAHGTSTITGDAAEIETLKEVYGSASSPTGISSVKSQIGHLLGGAGAAGIIKVLLAIQNRTLPPNGQFEKLSSRFSIDDSSLYIITECREWETAADRPRRAAVSSYGFGGINFHGVIEEYTDRHTSLKRRIFSDTDHDFNGDRIVISGIGTILPGARNTDEFWEKLASGKKDFTRIPESRLHNEYYSNAEEEEYRLPLVKTGVVEDYTFNNLKYRIPPKTALSTERAQFFALDSVSQAVKQACGEKADALIFGKGNKTGVILGTISGEKHVENIIRTRIPLIEKILLESPLSDAGAKKTIVSKLADALRERFTENNEDSTPGLLSNIVSGRVANYFGCHGANFIVDAACASSGIATDIAVKNLLAGDSDVVITGGVDANFYPGIMMVFKRLGLLSDGDAHVFDKRAKGVILSEGAAVMVMTTLKTAREKGLPVLSELSGIAFRSKAARNMYAPSESLFRDTTDLCYGKTPVSKNSVSHIDVFGFTGIMPDQIESQAVSESFGNEIYFGSIKPEFGYFKGANPAVTIARLALMAQNRKLLPHWSYDRENTIVPSDSTLKANDRVHAVADGQRFHVAANIFGFGANHGHAVVSALPGWLNEPRVAAGSETNAEKALHVRSAPLTAPTKRTGIAALLCGQGSQYPGMMAELYASNDHVRSVMDRAEKIFRSVRGESLLEIMSGSSGRLNSTENTQPAVFTATAAIYDILRENGFSPDLFIGHSVGEYSALYCSGMLDFEAAMRLVLTRSTLMKKADETHPGRIIVIFKNADESLSLIENSGLKDIHIANKNSDRQTAVSGDAARIDEFCAFLANRGVMHKKLDLTGAFHTPLLADAARQLESRIQGLKFNPVDFTRVISNVTGRPYPNDEIKVKELLVRQIISPVEFTESVHTARESGVSEFIEVGTGSILTGLLKYIDSGSCKGVPAIDTRTGEKKSLEIILEHIRTHAEMPLKDTGKAEGVVKLPEKGDRKINITAQNEETAYTISDTDDFNAFLEKNDASVRKVLYREYLKSKKEKKNREIEKLGFYTGAVAVAGVSVGLPGESRRVFSPKNFDHILAGHNFIESVSDNEKERLLDKNITRVLKFPNGNARLTEIKSTEDVIQLAGRLGYFDIKDYGVDHKYDIAISLAMAAGIEALKDAQIPLVQAFRHTPKGKRLPDGFALAPSMQESTGVILTSLFQGWEALIEEINAYYYNKFYVKPYEELENIYYHLMENIADGHIKSQITDWFFKIKERRNEFGEYKFDRNLLLNTAPMGSAHFAQLIRAKGPNVHLSGACASTTQACGVAEDWIRSGRCDRVIVIGSEAATSKNQNPWIGSGFLALGAASVKKNVEDAAKPFDSDRNGTVLGSGAVSLIIERHDTIRERGLNGQAEILGTYIGNSAFHPTRIDQQHLADEMKRFVEKVESRHELTKKDYAPKTVFMSHETYTPAKGGSADAEIKALRAAFGDDSRKLTITNTKGFTGHTLGAAIEDAVLVKALQKNKVPPIANLKNVPDEFKDLNFNASGNATLEYGLHFAAGFGSHFSFLFLKKLNEKSVQNNAEYADWLSRISGQAAPVLSEINNTLCVAPSEERESDGLQEIPAGSGPEEIPEKTEQARQPEYSQNHGNTIREIIAQQTGYTEDMLEDGLDLEADLGIDTVKQVEIFGKISAHFGLKVPEDLKLRDLNTISKLEQYINAQKVGQAPEAPAAQTDGTSGAGGRSEIVSAVKQIIAEQTGYTQDMLEEGLDLEADLGVDTVKQVEIFGKISAHFGLKVPEDLKLRDLNTISKLEQYINAQKVGQAPEAPAAQTDGTSGAGGRGEIVSAVRQIISEQTGYTQDMLEEGLDLEADLGVDTVKQVEIFGKISAHFGLKVPEDLKLRDLNSIDRLVTYIAAQTGSSGRKTEDADKAPEPYPQPPRTAPETGDGKSRVTRYTLTVRELDTPETSENMLDGKTFLVSTDRWGFSDRIIEIIRENGGRAVTIGTRESDSFNADLNNPENLVSIMERVKSGVDIKGFIHLHPLDAYFSDTDTAPETAGSVKSFFIIVRELHESLNRSGGILSMLSFDSVVFPYSDEPSGKINPVFAGVAGMMKTINKELPQASVKAVDFSIDTPLDHIGDIAVQYVNELTGNDTRVETGLKNGRRYGLSMIPCPASVSGSGIVSKEDTILVTGGARGITHEILKALSDRYSPRLVIIGRSDIDAIDEEFKNDDVDEAFILSRLKETMKGSKPLEIKKAAGRIMKTKETRLNIENLKSRGADVFYHAADVTDSEAVSGVVRQYDRIDGVIHAAGLEESAPLPKKRLQSFNRVFDTKIKGAGNLFDALEDRGYGYFITFSSVTARFGNEGQVDYTGANDMLGRLTQKMAGIHPEKTFKVMDWTAWSDAGMATDDTVKKVLESRNLTFLPLEQGVNFFMDELLDKDALEAVFTGPDQEFDVDGIMAAGVDTPAISPFLDRVTASEDNRMRFSRILDLKKDLFLKDHSMKDIPVFLGATGIETMAEAASRLLGKKNHRLSAVTDFSIPYGIKILKQRPKELEIETFKPETGDGSTLMCSISSRFKRGNITGKKTLHYKGAFHFADDKTTAPAITLPEFKPVIHEERLDRLIYHPERLFMDGSFKTIRRIVSFDEDLLITEVCHNGERDFFRGDARPEFLTDVIMVDAMFQTGGLFEFMTSSELVLPYRIKRLDFFRPVERGMKYLCLTRKTASGHTENTYHLQLADPSGNIFMEVDGFQMVKLAKLDARHRIFDKFDTAA